MFFMVSQLVRRNPDRTGLTHAQNFETPSTWTVLGTMF